MTKYTYKDLKKFLAKDVKDYYLQHDKEKDKISKSKILANHILKSISINISFSFDLFRPYEHLFNAMFTIIQSGEYRYSDKVYYFEIDEKYFDYIGFKKVTSVKKEEDNSAVIEFKRQQEEFYNSNK